MGGGAIPVLVATLSSTEPRKQLLAAVAIQALAVDDPESDDDNFHQHEICQAGAVPPLVKLLEAEETRCQGAATVALSTLAENPTCQTMIAAAGAIAPLLSM